MNLWWGLVMLAFGLWMLLMAFRGMAKARNLKAETRNE
jgi:hypothetical protein